MSRSSGVWGEKNGILKFLTSELSARKPVSTSSGSETKASKNPTAAKKPTVQAVPYVQTVQVVESFDVSENPRNPEILAQEIIAPRLASRGAIPSQGRTARRRGPRRGVEALEAALEQFCEIAADLGREGVEAEKY